MESVVVVIDEWDAEPPVAVEDEREGVDGAETSKRVAESPAEVVCRKTNELSDPTRLP